MSGAPSVIHVYSAKLYAFIQWEDGFVDVIDTAKIVHPKKAPNLYEEGEYVSAKFGSMPYKARISELSAEKSTLIRKRDKKPKPDLKYTYSSPQTEELIVCDDTVTVPLPSTSARAENLICDDTVTVPLPSKSARAENLICDDTVTVPLPSTSARAENLNEEENILKKRRVSFSGNSSPERSTGSPRWNAPEPLISPRSRSGNNEDLQKKYQKLRDRVRDLEKWRREVSPILSGLQKGPVHCESSPGTSATVPAPMVTASSHVPEELDQRLYNGHSLDYLRDSISHCDSLFSSVLRLMSQLFSKEYIVSHSISGQPSNSTTAAKPKFDGRLFEAMMTLIREKFPKATKSEVTHKIQAVQKKFKKAL